MCRYKFNGLFIIALFAITVSPIFAEGRVALVIGNGAYTGVPALTNPPNDVADMAVALKNAGFVVILKSNADLAGMELALTEFKAMLAGKDTALFFYAGHGLQVQMGAH